MTDRINYELQPIFKTMQLRIRRHFYAAHQLPYHDGPCRRLHGHRYEVELLLTGVPETDGPKRGMLADFADLKRTIDEHLPDHLALNPELPDAWGHAVPNPTAERLAQRLGSLLAVALMAEHRLKLERLELWETPDCSVRISRG